MDYISKAIKAIGAAKIGVACGLGTRAVHKWGRVGHMPYTEYTGKTNYAEVIEQLSHGEITREQLLSQQRGAKAAPIEQASA